MITDNASAKAQRIARRNRVWDLRLQGKTERDIATEIGTVSNVTIHNDLVYLIREATKHLDEVVKRERLIQLHQLHKVVSEAFEAWTESKKPGEQIIKAEGAPSKRNPDGTSSTTRIGTKQTGNPAYLTLAMKAMEDIRKLFGLDAFKDDWELELKNAGLNPGEVFEAMAQAAYVALSTKDKQDGRTDNLDEPNPPTE